MIEALELSIPHKRKSFGNGSALSSGLSSRSFSVLMALGRKKALYTMTSPTNQIKLLARLIFPYRKVLENAGFSFVELEYRSQIFSKEINLMMEEIEDQRRQKENRAAQRQRNREELRFILSDLPENTSAHARLQFAEKVLLLSTEELVRRRNAQNLFRDDDLPQREVLEVACQVVSAEMVRRRRKDFAGVTAIEHRVAGDDE